MRQLIAALALLALGCGAAAAEAVPLPRPRPAIVPDFTPQSFAEAAGPNFDSAAITDKPTACDERLARLAAFSPMPRLIGPATCGGEDMVELEAVMLADKTRVAVDPPALLRCPMAESFAAWLREEVAPRAAKLGSTLRAVENYDSYECRPRNRVAGAKMSEHGKGNAIDVRAIHLADGRRIEPTDMLADKSWRETMRESACHRFMTVLGPGSDGHHESHIHLDVAARRNGYRICQWAVREPPPAVAVAAAEPEPAADADKDGAVMVRVRLPTPRPAIMPVHVKHSRKL